MTLVVHGRRERRDQRPQQRLRFLFIQQFVLHAVLRHHALAQLLLPVGRNAAGSGGAHRIQRAVKQETCQDQQGQHTDKPGPEQRMVAQARPADRQHGRVTGQHGRLQQGMIRRVELPLRARRMGEKDEAVAGAARLELKPVERQGHGNPLAHELQPHDTDAECAAGAAIRQTGVKGVGGVCGRISHIHGAS